MPISFHFSGETEKAPRLFNSLGLSKTRIHFYPGFEKNKDKYAVYAQKIILKQGKTVPKNNWRFVYHRVENSNVVYKINKSSLQKRLGITSKELKSVTNHHYENLIQQKLSGKGVQFQQEAPPQEPREKPPIITDIPQVMKEETKPIVSNPPTIQTPQERDASKLLNLLNSLSSPIIPLEGQFKHSSKVGTIPDLIKSGTRDLPLIDTDKTYSVAMSACFHSDLRMEESRQWIQDICEASDPSLKNSFFSETTKGVYFTLKVCLYNNLVNLHEALPGNYLKKSSKIYFTDSIEKELIPHLLKNERVDPLTLGFIFTHGEVVNNLGEAEGVFQSEAMDAGRQLQFVTLDWQRKKDELIKGIKSLVLGSTEEVETVINEWPGEDGFLRRTEILTYLNQTYNQLYEAAKKGERFELELHKMRAKTADDTFGVQLYSEWLGGREKYYQLPTLDLLKLESWKDHKNRPSNIPLEKVSAPIMRGTNGFVDSDYLIVKFRINVGSQDHGPGMQVFYTRNDLGFRDDCHSNDTDMDLTRAGFRLIRKKGETNHELLNELLTKGEIKRPHWKDRSNEIHIELIK